MSFGTDQSIGKYRYIHFRYWIKFGLSVQVSYILSILLDKLDCLCFDTVESRENILYVLQTLYLT